MPYCTRGHRRMSSLEMEMDFVDFVDCVVVKTEMRFSGWERIKIVFGYAVEVTTNSMTYVEIGEHGTQPGPYRYRLYSTPKGQSRAVALITAYKEVAPIVAAATIGRVRALESQREKIAILMRRTMS